MTVDTTQGLGELLRQLRLGAGLTLEALAELSGVSDRAISDIERGASRGPQRRTVELLADALSLDDGSRAGLLAAARAGRHRQAAGPVGRAPLPDDVADFTGREAQVARLAALLVSGVPGRPAPIAVVSGPPGFGKTALTVHAATSVADNVDATVFVDLHGYDDRPVDVLSVLTRLTGAVDPSSHVSRNLDEGIESWQRAVEGKRVVVVLDNAATEDHVRPLLPAIGPAAAVVTSRGALAGLESVERVTLTELDAADSIMLLRGIVPERSIPADELERLASLCHHLPLALRLSGNQLASRTDWTVEDLASQLSGGDLGLHSTIGKSYDRLSGQGRLLFRRLALLRAGSFRDAMAGWLADVPLDTAEDLLDELLDLGLLQTAAQGRYQLHDLLRVFARERLDKEEDVDATSRAGERLRHGILSVTVQAGRWFEPGYYSAPADPDPLVPLSRRELADGWLQAELDHWIGAFDDALEAQDHQRVIDVAESLHWYSDLSWHAGHWHHIYAGGVTAARALDDDDQLATQLGYLSWTETGTRSDPGTGLTVAQEAHAVARRAGNRVQEGWARYYEAWALGDLLRADEALVALSQASDLLDGADDEGYVQTLGMHSPTLWRLERFEEALEVESRLLEVLDDPERDLNPALAQLARLGSAAAVAHSQRLLGRFGEAIESTTAGLAIDVIPPAPHWTWVLLTERAGSFAGLGRLDEARTDYRRAIEVAETMGATGRADRSRDQLAQLGG